MNLELSSVSPLSFKDLLFGKNAFYHSPDYLESTLKDLAEKTTLPISYSWDSEHKIIRITKQILSFTIFPVGIYQLIHSLVGKIFLLPASTPLLMGLPTDYADKKRSTISLNDNWKYKRLTIEADGYKIDAMIIGKISTLGNGRWVMASNGNGEFYEQALSLRNDSFKKIMKKIKANGIVFNYPGVGASSGLPNKKAMIKAYKAILAFLEDEMNGIGAKEIVGYGHSIGGGVQGDALKTHPLKKGIKYVFIKSRTFSSLATVASYITVEPSGLLLKILGWNIDSVESSKYHQQVPEIIMQTAKVNNYEVLLDSSKIIDDGVIPAEASLAKTLLDDDECVKKNKKFIGIMEGHNNRLIDPSYLAHVIENYLTHPTKKE